MCNLPMKSKRSGLGFLILEYPKTMFSKQSLVQQAALCTPRLKLEQRGEKYFAGMVVCEAPGFGFVIT
jgi:hypothetical protein